ncbi:MAG: hypothetical protein KDI03_12975 [Anaerolineae bacterium]|nr:hypothetical protein [Anaerolineae bacterium]MCB0200976.1 hypothetical protein [Anaerolineae bacterium]
MKRLALLLFLITALMLAACGGGDEAPADTSAPTTAPQPAATEQADAPAAASTNTPVPPTDTPVVEEADEPLAQLGNLDNLKSYRARTQYQGEGAREDGTPVNDVVTVESAYVNDAGVDKRYMSMQLESLDAEEIDGFQGFEFYQIGTDMYMYGGEETGWVRISGEQSPFQDPSSEFLLDSSVIFTDLDSLNRERPDEKIAGIDSRHYTFDERAMLNFLNAGTGNVSAEGEVWIAKDGDFVTKYIVNVTVDSGGAGMLDPTLANGTLRLEFELTEANEDVTIDLPEEAISGTNMAGFGGEPLPLPEGATVTASTSQFAIVQTDLPVEEVQQFYDDALQGLGWTMDDAGSMSFGDMVSLAYTKDNAKLTVLIQADESTGTTQVMINAEESQ